MIELKGMTWDHSRGYDPMIATSEEFKKKNDNNIKIHWDKRPLQAFADRPIEEMTDNYDLIVIDYPHVGEIAAKELLENFDKPAYTYKLSILAKESVGKSHQSYFINNDDTLISSKKYPKFNNMDVLIDVKWKKPGYDILLFIVYCKMTSSVKWG